MFHKFTLHLTQFGHTLCVCHCLKTKKISLHCDVHVDISSISLHFFHPTTIPNYRTSLIAWVYWALPPKGHRDYCIRSNFRKFYLTRIGFTLGESVSLVKVFKLDQMFLVVQSVNTVGRCTTSYLLAGPERVCDTLCFQPLCNTNYPFWAIVEHIMILCGNLKFAKDIPTWSSLPMII
jgi:hypothetical protein